MLQKESLREILDRRTYQQAVDYYLDHRVEISYWDEKKVTAQVVADRTYLVNISDYTIMPPHAHCNCRVPDTCKHIVAVLLKLVDIRKRYHHFHEERAEKTDAHTGWQEYLRQVSAIQEKNLSQSEDLKYKIIFHLHLRPESWNIAPKFRYQLKDGAYGRELEITSDQVERRDVQMSLGEKMVFRQLAATRHHGDSRFSSYLGLPYGANVGELLQLLRHSRIYLGDDEETRISVYPKVLRADFRLVEDDSSGKHDLQLHLVDEDQTVCRVSGEFRLLTIHPVFLFHSNVLYELAGELSFEQMQPFILPAAKIEIANDELSQALNQLFPVLSRDGNMVFPASMKLTEVDVLSGKRLYLHERDGELLVEAFFTYGSESLEVSTLSPDPVVITEDAGKYYRVVRQLKVEELWAGLLLRHQLRVEGGFFVLPRQASTLDWLFDELPKLAESGFEIFGEDKLKTLRVRRASGVISSSVSSGIDWLDLEIQLEFGGATVTLQNLQRAMRKQSRYVRLSDGSNARIDEKMLEKLGFILRQSTVKGEAGKLRFSRYQVLTLNEIMQFSDLKRFDEGFKEKLAQLKSFDSIPGTKLPAGFQGELRPYQKFGFDWMNFLNQHEFGGCLADDMGLGKTVQALALLQKSHKKQKVTSLIVAPTSVLFNWEHELKRFTPGLKYQVHTGKNRSEDNSVFRKYDVIITSYALLWRDFDLLRDFGFHYLVLDESQKIKNANSLTAKCARGVQARHRLVMTGTPLENNTLELWSQFHFLNPGMFGSLNHFRENFANPIERDNDTDALARLKRLINPFILRRTKEEVVSELPEKMETVVYCSMDEHQEKMYHRWRDTIRKSILEEIEEKGVEKIKIKLLEGLTRLRQISIHPALVDESYRYGSGKFENLIDNIAEIVGEGHKALIFSQFVKMLSILRKHLDRVGIPYAYLDGSTRDREQQVNNFQTNPDLQLFLISLKAGGTGLNLTAADYVIHIDPWWNPAVELQATDRAHRIGQTKKVFVYKLITRDSVEEKIIDLQGRKKDITSKLITSDANFVKKLSRDDIMELLS